MGPSLSKAAAGEKNASERLLVHLTNPHQKRRVERLRYGFKSRIAKLPSIIQLPCASARGSVSASTNSIEILVAFQLPPLNSLSRTNGLSARPIAPLASTTHRTARDAIPWWRQAAARGSIPLIRATVIGPRALIVKAAATSSHRPRMMHLAVLTWNTDTSTGNPAIWCSDCMVSKVRERVGKAVLGWESCEVRHHGHVSQIEASRSASGKIVIVHWKVAVAVGIGSRRRNMRGIQHVGVDKDELWILSVSFILSQQEIAYIFTDGIKPFSMTLLDMLAPETFAFEQLGTLWHLTPKFRLIFLLYVLL